VKGGDWTGEDASWSLKSSFIDSGKINEDL